MNLLINLKIAKNLTTELNIALHYSVCLWRKYNE